MRETAASLPATLSLSLSLLFRIADCAVPCVSFFVWWLLSERLLFFVLFWFFFFFGGGGGGGLRFLCFYHNLAGRVFNSEMPGLLASVDCLCSGCFGRLSCVCVCFLDTL